MKRTYPPAHCRSPSYSHSYSFSCSYSYSIPRRKHHPRPGICTGFRLAACLAALCVLSPRALAGTGASWPTFHGPNRDNISAERGLLKTWPAGGPKLLWTFPACGKGYSNVAVAAGRLFTAGDFGDEEFVLAVDPNGRALWRSGNGKAWRGASPGSRATPTWSDGLVYHLNPTGRLAAWRDADGNEVWSVDLVERFGARRGTWALAESLAVDANVVLCLPCGRGGLMAGLDRKTGRTAWVCRYGDDRAAYCSPLLVTLDGRRAAVTLTAAAVVAVEVRTGKLLWRQEHAAPHGQNATTPVVAGGCVFVAGGHSRGGTLFRIAPDAAGGLPRLWHRKDLDNCHGGAVLLDGRLYTSGCRLGGKDFFCVDWLTGKDIARSAAIGKVAVSCADGRLYCLNERGRMTLLEPTAEGFRTAGQFDLPRGDGACFAHPVVCGGRLYARWGRNLYCYDIRDGGAGP